MSKRAFDAQAVYDYSKSREALSRILTILGVGLASGASLRAGFGAIGNMRRNVRRAVRNDESEKRLPVQRFELPVKQSAADLPNWYYPATAVTTVGSTYVGWDLLDKWLKARQAARRRQEVADAKSDFESAMLESLDAGQQPKLAAFRQELDELSRAYADGELDETVDMYKDAKWPAGLGLLQPLFDNPAYATLASIIALGSAGTTASMMSKTNPEKERIRIYEEAMRRKRMAKLQQLEGVIKPVAAQPQTQHSSESKTTDPEEVASSKSGSVLRKYAVWAPAIAPSLTNMAKSVIGKVAPSIMGAATKAAPKIMGAATAAKPLASRAISRAAVPAVSAGVGAVGTGMYMNHKMNQKIKDLPNMLAPGGQFEMETLRPTVETYLSGPQGAEFRQWLINRALGQYGEDGNYQWSPLADEFRQQYPLLGALLSLGTWNRAPRPGGEGYMSFNQHKTYG